MNRNKTDSDKKSITFTSLTSNNKFVFIFSLVLAVIIWCIVSMSETTETERVFQDVLVKINLDGSLPQQNNLEVFGQKEFKVNVTVKGLSYLVNDSDFTAEDINVTASCAGVAEAGTYSLPLTYSLNGRSSVQITSVSAQSINVTFDKLEKKTFILTEEIIEADGYSLEEDFSRELPRLSVESIDISGPASLLSKISTVNARVVLDSTLDASVSLEAEIIAMSGDETVDLSDCTIEQSEPVYVYIPVKKTGTFNTAVEFKNLPTAFRTDGVNYTVSPASIDVKVDVGTDENVDTVTVGVIDFGILRAGVNTVTVNNSDLLSDVKAFTVTVDLTGFSERWVSDIPVVLSDVEIPDNVTVITKDIDSVIIVCPPELSDTIDSNVAYAVPVINASELTQGRHTVPAKIVLRTLQNSWVYGEYTMEIEVK